MYFVTCVIYRRRALLLDHVDIFWESVHFAQEVIPFDMIAWSILSDHFHLIVKPPEKDLSEIMRRMKLKFSGLYRSLYGLARGRIWQHRFWDHIIRNRDDMNHHLDYIHYNPVKHGLVRSPFEYQHSSIHQYLENGHYQSDWGLVEPTGFDGEYGE